VTGLRAAAGAASLLALAIFGSLLGGLALGGTLVNGQTGPLLWLECQALSMLLLGLVAATVARRWRDPMVCVGMAGSLTSIALICGLSARIWPWREMTALLVVSLLALLAGLSLAASSGKRRRIWIGVACLLLLGSAILLHRMDYAASPANADTVARPAVAVVSALPLFWQPDERPARRSPAPALTLLENSARIVPLDTLDPARLAPYRHLLLAQPHQLAPAELVALDGWVRAGGRAVILADPLLLWPMRLAQGDRRRPPLTSLLDPLLTHWGLRLEPVAPGEEGVDRRFLTDGALLPVAAASRFAITSDPACRLSERGLFALCQIGTGRVRLVADADLLDDRLWLADPYHPGSRRAQSGDTVELLAQWMADPLDNRPVVHPFWARDAAALVTALRWGLLDGTGWVMLGLVLVWRWEKLVPAGKEVDPIRKIP
jgi:hypothetical protein